MWLVLLGACDFGNLQDQLEGLTNPLVAEGMVIGVAEPADDRIDLSALDYDPGANVTVFLADAANADELDAALVSGAMVSASDGQSSADLEEAESGVYTTVPGAGFDYVAERTATVTAVLDDTTGNVSVELPQTAGLTIMEAHTAGQAIDIDVTGLGYTGSLVVVFDTTSGDVTYSNEPTTAKEVYDLTRGNNELTVVTVPGEAFPGESVYALGFAGLVHSRSADVDGLNTLLSGVIAGQLEFHPVVTLTVP
ncbi:MAG: hypothetical protein KTR31_22250 [Myxococcales bacterium]|nr:hypothetical protein [Myxococcales bacterium]